MWPIIAGAVLGGLGSAISNASQARAINEKIRRVQALMAENIVDSGELSSRLHSVDRMFNQRLTSVLNTTAIRSRGYANTGTIGAAAAGAIEGEHMAASNTIVENAYANNKNVNQQIAMVGMEAVSPDAIGSFVSGAVSGAGVGIEAMNMMNAGNIDVPGETPGSDIGSAKVPPGETIDAGFGSYSQSGTYKTGLGTWQSGLAGFRAVDDEDLWNFYTPGTWDRLSGVRPRIKK